MTIHKEGYTTISIMALMLVLLNVVVHNSLSDWPWLAAGLSLSSAVFLICIALFFRSPSRRIELQEDCLLSPADGKIVAIEEILEMEYFKDKRIQVSVFMSPLDVHLNRYPVSGKVKYFKHHNGHFHVAWHPKSSSENERTSTVLGRAKGPDILFRQVAGAVARRIVSYARVSDGVVQGTECGFIKFGSRVDVLLPADTKLQVEIGDRVKGGISVLARFSE